MLAGAGQTPPPDDVVLAFGGTAALVPLAGGQGRSWRAGPVVLKPAGGERPELLEWLAGSLAVVDPQDAFRLATPLPATGSRWIVDGWQAATWLDGAHVPEAWDRVLEVSADFHRATAAAVVPSPAASGPPPVLAGRGDPWAIGDRVAWGEREADAAWPAGVLGVLDRLRPLLEHTPPAPTPPAGPSADAAAQLVHGDLAGNVLFADDAGLPPAVIDVSPFWRPPGYADAIVVADAVAWEGAPPTLALRFLARQEQAAGDGDALLARAIVFRVATAALHWSALPDRVAAEVHAYSALLPLLRS